MIDSVPLIQNANDAQQINASIIAMKKASKELDEKIVKLNSLNSELDKKIALLDSGLNKEIEDRKEAINSLDVASVGGSGKYISAISETDGKISATAGDITSSVSSGNSQPVTSGGVASAMTYKKGQMSNEFYSGGTYNGGFVLLAHAQTRNISGSKSIAISGNVFLSIQNTSDYSRHLDSFEFLLSVRNTSASTIFPADFRVSSKDGNTQSISSLFFATYKVDSSGVVHIYLYTKIVNYYNRYICEVENFFTGDVYDNVNLPDAKVDMTTAHYSSIPSDQNIINVTPSITDSVNNGDLRAITSNAVYNRVKIKEITGTTSANGNLQFGLAGTKVVILAIQTANSDGFLNDVICIPYKLGGGDITDVPTGDGRWGGHFMSSLSSQSVFFFFSVYATISYIEFEH